MKNDYPEIKFNDFQEFEYFLNCLISTSFYTALILSEDFLNDYPQLEEENVSEKIIEACFTTFFRKHKPQIINIAVKKFQNGIKNERKK